MSVFHNMMRHTHRRGRQAFSRDKKYIYDGIFLKELLLRDKKYEVSDSDCYRGPGDMRGHAITPRKPLETVEQPKYLSDCSPSGTGRSKLSRHYILECSGFLRVILPKLFPHESIHSRKMTSDHSSAIHQVLHYFFTSASPRLYFRASNLKIRILFYVIS